MHFNNTSDLKALFAVLRENGVTEFSLNGLAVKLGPVPLSAEVVAEVIQEKLKQGEVKQPGAGEDPDLYAAVEN